MKEEHQIDSSILDSSVWIAYLFEGKNKEQIENDNNFVSILSIFEIKKKLLDKKVAKDDINKNIKFIKERATILYLTDEIVEKAAELSLENKIPAIDSMIYSTALTNNLSLMSKDNDFRNLPNVLILGK